MQLTPFDNWDFTLNKYECLCQAIAASKYSVVTLADYLQGDAIAREKPHIILRHDIDRTPKRALDVAQIESRYGLQTTYYFRTSTYKTNIIDKIADLGHEVGYHYETLDKSKGNLESAIKIFAEELVAFREIYNVKTVCAHGNPLTKFDNKTIWKQFRLSDFGLTGEAFLSLDFTRFAYFSDSGRTWVQNEAQKIPGKDSVITRFDETTAKNTDDVIQIVKNGELPNICILTHPERWCSDILSYMYRLTFDLACSNGKWVLHKFRQGKTAAKGL